MPLSREIGPLLLAGGAGGGGLFSGLKYTLVSITADPAPAVMGTVYIANANAAAFNITLPTAIAAGAGAWVMVKKVDGSQNPVTIRVAVASGNLIDGFSNDIVAAQYETVLIVTDGVNSWWNL